MISRSFCHNYHKRSIFDNNNVLHFDNYQNKMTSGEFSVGAKKRVKAGETHRLMEIDRIVAWKYRCYHEGLGRGEFGGLRSRREK